MHAGCPINLMECLVHGVSDTGCPKDFVALELFEAVPD